MDNFSFRVDSLTEAVAAELRAERARRRVPQVKIADAIGRGQSYVSDRLNGKAPLSLDEFVIVATVLGIKPDELLRNVLAKYKGAVYGDAVVELVTVADVGLAADDDPSYATEDHDSNYDNA